MNAITHRILSWVWIMLALSACSSQAIQVAKVEPTEQHLRTETLDLRNCDHLEAFDQSLDQQSSVVQVISLADEATIQSTGEMVPLSVEIRAQVEAQIERSYHSTYDAAQDMVSASQLYVPPDRIRMYELRWKERRYSGNVAFKIENQPCSMAYSYTLTIPELGDYKEMACTA